MLLKDTTKEFAQELWQKRMKSIIVLTVIVLLQIIAVQSVCAKRFQFRLKNSTDFKIEVYVQIIKENDFQTNSPNYLLILQPYESKEFQYPVKKNERIKFIGKSSETETLPLLTSFEVLSTKKINEYELLFPILQQFDVIGIDDMIIKNNNDMVLKNLTNQEQYSKDEMPPLGTFLFISKKDGKLSPQHPLYWKNEKLIRVLNRRTFITTDYIDISHNSKVNVIGIPFLKKLSTSFNKSSVMEVVFNIKNAHFEQWTADDISVYDILKDTKNKLYLNACIDFIDNNSLSYNDYELLFVSSIYVVDTIVISGRKYNKIELTSGVDFSSTIEEIVKPIGIGIDYAYKRDKTYLKIDSTINASLKVFTLDYTFYLQSLISDRELNRRRIEGEKKLDHLRESIISSYHLLQKKDSSLISSNSVETIIQIMAVTPKLEMITTLADSTIVDQYYSERKFIQDYNRNLDFINQQIQAMMNIRHELLLYERQIVSRPVVEQKELDNSIIEQYILQQNDNN